MKLLGSALTYKDLGNYCFQSYKNTMLEKSDNWWLWSHQSTEAPKQPPWNQIDGSTGSQARPAYLEGKPPET